MPFKCVQTMGGVVVHLPESDRKSMASAPFRILAAQIKMPAYSPDCKHTGLDPTSHAPSGLGGRSGGITTHNMDALWCGLRRQARANDVVIFHIASTLGLA